MYLFFLFGIFRKVTGEPRGFGFVEFADAEEAANAIQSLNAQPIKG